jgi:hypothetical protein
MSLYGEYNSDPSWAETFRKFWPDVRNRHGADKAIQLAVYSYGWLIGLQVVFLLLPADRNLWVLVEIAFVAVVAAFVRRRSLFSAVVGVVYFAGSWFVTLFSQATGLLFLIISALLFVGTLNGIRGAMALRRQARDERLTTGCT